MEQLEELEKRLKNHWLEIQAINKNRMTYKNVREYQVEIQEVKQKIYEVEKMIVEFKNSN